MTYVIQVGEERANIELDEITYEKIESNIIRCPDEESSRKMIKLIEEVKREGDSVGGVIECVIKNIPSGLGEPVFDKLSADLAHACMSIPATKGFEIGSGFEGAKMKGSEHNDSFCISRGNISTKTNYSGGIQGGISNGQNIILRIAFKPTSTILKTQETVNESGEEILLDNVRGRHDPCVVPRAVPIVESMILITLIDHHMRNVAQNNLF